jgi:hypothetical protein
LERLQVRDDGVLLEDFTDESNELMLFIGWFDYMNAAPSLPIEVQVFQLWVWAKHLDSLASGHDREIYESLFPNLASMPADQQKAALRARIAWARQHGEVMGDLKTDPRSLALGRL